MYLNVGQRKQGSDGSLIQHNFSGVHEVEAVPVPVLDNKGPFGRYLVPHDRRNTILLYAPRS
jgi:hypothetical protein